MIDLSRIVAKEGIGEVGNCKAVSYTHLDVYKRQVRRHLRPVGRFLRHRSSRISVPVWMLFLQASCREDAPIAVSYTHLDVYKRQVIMIFIEECSYLKFGIFL